MALQDKYKELWIASASGVIRSRPENKWVLYVNGEAPSGRVKDNFWDIYGKMDPDFVQVMW
jgi:hypothetical protein